MDRFVIAGVPGYDGEYEFDPDRAFNTREWRWIRKLSDHTPYTISEGYENTDPDLFVAFVVICMCREGKITKDEWEKTAEDIAEVPLDGSTLRLVIEPVEVEESPLALTSTRNDPSTSSVLEKTRSDEPRSNGSGMTSKNGSEQSDENPQPTTLLRLGTS